MSSLMRREQSLCQRFQTGELLSFAHSHITQPLDVGIFGPLKAGMARANDRAAIYDRGRIPKAEWASQLAVVRTTAMTEHNIWVGWKATGLHPFSPQRVLNTVPSTPSPVRPLSRSPLASLTGENIDFLQSCSPSLPSPVNHTSLHLYPP